MNVRCFESIVDVESSIQDLSTPHGSFFYKFPWLRHQEGNLTPTSYYLLAEEGDLALGMVAAYLFDEAACSRDYFTSLPDILVGEPTLRMLSPHLTSKESARLQVQVRTAGTLIPSLIATTPHGFTSGIAVPRSLGSDREREVARLVVSEFEELCDRLEAESGAFLYVPEGIQPALEEALRESEFLPLPIDSECYLPVEWANFDGYLASFSSGRRASIRREIRAFELSGIELRVESGDFLTEDLAPLAVSSAARYGHDLELDYVGERFKDGRRHLKKWLSVVVASLHGEPVGFMAAYEWEGVLYLKAFGLNYEKIPRGSFCYFNLGFYEPVRLAISRGLQEINFSCGTAEAKVARGCKLRRMMAYIRFRSDERRREYQEIIEIQQRARQQPLFPGIAYGLSISASGTESTPKRTSG